MSESTHSGKTNNASISHDGQASIETSKKRLARFKGTISGSFNSGNSTAKRSRFLRLNISKEDVNASSETLTSEKRGRQRTSSIIDVGKENIQKLAESVQRRRTSGHHRISSSSWGAALKKKEEEEDKPSLGKDPTTNFVPLPFPFSEKLLHAHLAGTRSSFQAAIEDFQFNPYETIPGNSPTTQSQKKLFGEEVAREDQEARLLEKTVEPSLEDTAFKAPEHVHPLRQHTNVMEMAEQPPKKAALSRHNCRPVSMPGSLK
ncbi:MAG: hypothetical protein Q9227_006582 [Pyrenula ochraceoflavens]